jgi:hypothetical protein
MKRGTSLVAVAPQLVRAMEEALRSQGAAELAVQVSGLRITEVCRCDQPYCGSFWTTSLPMKRWFARGRQVALGAGLPGEVTLDLVRGEIAYVEVLHWDEVRDAVLGGAQRP